MKRKMGWMLLLLLIAMIVSACGGGSTPATEAGESESPATEAAVQDGTEAGQTETASTEAVSDDSSPAAIPVDKPSTVELNAGDEWIVEDNFRFFVTKAEPYTPEGAEGDFVLITFGWENLGYKDEYIGPRIFLSDVLDEKGEELEEESLMYLDEVKTSQELPLGETRDDFQALYALKNPSEEITVAIRLYIGDNMMPHEAIYKLPITK